MKRARDGTPAKASAKPCKSRRPAPAPWIGCTDLPNVPDLTNWMCLGGQELDGNRLFLAFRKIKLRDSSWDYTLMGVTWQLPVGPVLTTMFRVHPECSWYFPRLKLVCSGVVVTTVHNGLVCTSRITPDLTLTKLNDAYINDSSEMCVIDYASGQVLRQNERPPRLKSLGLASESHLLVSVPFVGFSQSVPWLHESSGAVLSRDVKDGTTLALHESDGVTIVVAALSASVRCLTMTTGIVVVDERRIRVFRELGLRAAWVRCVVVCVLAK
jgi:hypothetical protein